jgi:membrane-anchored glycerophosphoryl diester phosphodiesterase (GDPDase)
VNKEYIYNSLIILFVLLIFFGIGFIIYRDIKSVDRHIEFCRKQCYPALVIEQFSKKQCMCQPIIEDVVNEQ